MVMFSFHCRQISSKRQSNKFFFFQCFFVILKYRFTESHKEIYKRGLMHPSLSLLQCLTSCTTTVQYQNQESGIDTIHRAHSDLVSYIKLFLCVCALYAVLLHVQLYVTTTIVKILKCAITTRLLHVTSLKPQHSSSCPGNC